MAFFSDTRFVSSAAAKDGWPESTLPEVLLVGKSNVGKSSLINTLAERKKLAYVGKTPGKTRLLNFFAGEGLMIVDAPGYGYANRSKAEYENYQKLMDDYLSERENLKLIIWVLDIRRDPNGDDYLMLQWLKAAKKPFISVFNKADTLSGNGKTQRLAALKTALKPDVQDFVLFSGKSGLGKAELTNKIAVSLGLGEE